MPRHAAVRGAPRPSRSLPEPDQARPSMTHGPAETIRLRVMNSGTPGGAISARGSMRVTGSPGSSSELAQAVRATTGGSPSNGRSTTRDPPEPLDARHPVPARDDEPQRKAVLRRQRLRRSSRTRAAPPAGGRRRARGCARSPCSIFALEAVVEPGEDDLDRAVGDARLARARPAAAVPRQRAVPTASSTHGWLTTCGSISARPLPAHSIVAAQLDGRQARGCRRATARAASERARRPRAGTSCRRPRGMS